MALRGAPGGGKQCRGRATRAPAQSLLHRVGALTAEIRRRAARPSGSGSRVVAALCLFLALSAVARPLRAADALREKVSTGDWGGVGLLQTRTARFNPDGQFTVGGLLVEPYNRVYLNWQILPGMEATFRYFSDDRIGQRSLDRGVDVKFRLFEEGPTMPEVALGFQDLLGTGLFSGEYLVASKRFHDFDFSLGLAWGYSVGGSGLFTNPLTLVSDRFRTRAGTAGQGGQFRFGNFFSGEEVALFGGVEYHTPIEGLSLKLEYDPNDYTRERSAPISQTLPLNVGVVYRPFDWVEMSLGFERGDAVMTRVALRTNFNGPGISKFADTRPPGLAIRPRPGMTIPGAPGQAAAAPATLSKAALDRASIDLLATEMERQGVVLEAVELAEPVATVHLSLVRPSRIEQQVRAFAPTIIASVPPEFTQFRFRVASGDRGRREITLSRQEAMRQWLVDALFDRLEAQQLAVESVDAGADNTTVRVASAAPRSEVDYLVAARAVRDLSPVPTATVTILASQDGRLRSSLVLDVASGGHVYSQQLAGADIGGDAARAGTGEALPAAQVQAIADKIFDELLPHGLIGEAFHLTTLTATIAVTPTRFPEVARNVGRTARVVASHVPASVEEIVVIIRSLGVPVTRVSIVREHLEDAVLGTSSPEELLASTRVDRPLGRFPAGAVENVGLYPKFDWSLGPSLRQSVGAPEAPYLFQIWAALSGRVEFIPGLSVRATVGANIFNTFDQITRGPKGHLPHVRSNIKEYLQRGQNNLVRLQADYLFTPARDWYARASVGYFEEMFAGIGGEILYRRQDSRWAVGLDLNYVRQRDFDQRFELQDYGVTTGHLSVYYKLPWHDLEAVVHAGRYLAGDWGATFQLARRFESGVAVGAFFTRTNVSAKAFGEGSFDKGFFITIPLNLLLPTSTRRGWGLLFRPLTSDGGQMLIIGPKLYDMTEEGQLGRLNRDWRRFLE